MWDWDIPARGMQIGIVISGDVIDSMKGGERGSRYPGDT
jgi:hypothetical protein